VAADRPETVAADRPAPVTPPRPAPAVERPGPAPADHFIPPRPVDPGRRHALGGQAKPFAAAAMANGAPEPAPPAEPRRTRTLFERVTGSVRSRKAQAERRPEPQPEPELEDAVVPTTPEPEGVTLPRVEEDLLDIPAFLRRQAN
jgi:cell division protein FtsZ